MQQPCRLERTVRRLIRTVLVSLALGAGLTAVDLAGVAPPAQAATTRAGIVAVAAEEVGASQANGECLKYGRCRSLDWCAMFVEWVWRQAGVSPVPTTDVATEMGDWGQQRGLFKRRPSGGLGSPLPGDLAVYGDPQSGRGGHVSIVESVNADGTITTIDGNFDTRVARRTIDPRTARSGAREQLISGYVTPPGLAPSDPPLSITGSGVGAVTHGGVLRVFARGTDGALWQALYGGTGWVWQDVGGQIVGNPSAVMYGGALRVFARGTDGALWQALYDGTGWVWQDLGGQIAGGPGVLAVAVDAFGPPRVGGAHLGP